jgi:hypothetical protein
LSAELSKSNKIKFLIDTGAEISVVKYTSLRPGYVCQPDEGIKVKGISNTVLKPRVQ